MKKIAGFLTIAVMMFSSAHVDAQQVATIGLGDITYRTNNKSVKSSEGIVAALYQRINIALTKTRKFAVMDYSQLTTRLERQSRSLDGYYYKQYTGNAIWQEGLDYILKANVTNHSLLNKTAEGSGHALGAISFDFQLFGVADVTYDFKSTVKGQASALINSGGRSTALDQAIDTSIDQLVDKIVSSLFPIHIVKIADDEDLENYGEIMLNYGDGFLKRGDTVLVYPPKAEVIIDKLGNPVGDAVATLSVISTNQRFSIAQRRENSTPLGAKQEPLRKGQKGRVLLTRRTTH